MPIPVCLRLVAGLLVCAVGAAVAADPFPTVEQMPLPARWPVGASWSVDQDGNLLVNGRARTLLGPQLSGAQLATRTPTAGYPAELCWLYEDPFDAQVARRLGFDTWSIFTVDRWIQQRVDPGYGSFQGSSRESAELERMVRAVDLPLYVDFTCAPWSHGTLHHSSVIAEAAKNVGGIEGEGNHWTPYSATTPEGRELYRLMWEDGVRLVVGNGGKPLFYELFNEPAYDDPSPANRALFAVWLRERHGDIATLNRRWRTAHADFAAAAAFAKKGDHHGRFVDWSEFMEDRFADLCAFGTATIRAVDPRPEAGICVQVMGGDLYRALPKSNINLWKVGRHCTWTATPTGGGIDVWAGPQQPSPSTIDAPAPERSLVEGLLQRRYLRAISAGKPIVNGEFYLFGEPDEITLRLWLDLVRGGNATYLFVWDKRAWDWTPTPDEAAGRRQAERFPYQLLNPYAVSVERLAAIPAFKREVVSLGDLFERREPLGRADLALLVSHHSERLAQAEGTPLRNEVVAWAGALHGTQHPYDVVIDEMLAEAGDATLAPYRTLIAAGTDAISTAAAQRLMAWVARGGNLVLAAEALQRDPWGAVVGLPGLDLVLGPPATGAPGILVTELDHARIPGRIVAKPHRSLTLGTGWTSLATIEGHSVIAQRSLGKGTVVMVGLRTVDHHLAALVEAVAGRLGHAPEVDLRRDDQPQELAPNVEVHRDTAVGGELRGLFLVNWNRFPQAVRLTSAHLGRMGGEQIAIDPVTREELPLRDGALLAPLAAQRRQMVISGSRKALTARFGPLTTLSVAEVAKRCAVAAPVATPNSELPAFTGDSRRMKPLDLRAVVNRAFTDQTPGDGKGGWTDQGENSLQNVPWGVQTLAGIPFDLIRPDMNEGRAMLTLASPQEPEQPRTATIPVDDRIGRLFVAHATAWTRPGAIAATYVVRYADGSHQEVPIVCGTAIDEWWLPPRPPAAGSPYLLAWRNREQRGFYAWSWANPHPDRPVTAIEVRSSMAGPIPLIVAMTIERPGQRDGGIHQPLIDPPGSAGWQQIGWSGVTIVPQPALTDQPPAWLLRLAPGAADWCGARFAAGPDLAVALPEPVRAGALRFALNGSHDEWGRHQGGQGLQISLTARIADAEQNGPYIELSPYLPGGRIDADAATWQTVTIPLEQWFPTGTPTAISGIGIQYTAQPPTAGVQIRQVEVIAP